jgi:hypothetical protein
VEETDARAVLGVSTNASREEVEAAYSGRVREVRKQCENARDRRTREKCRRERDFIDEARRLLLDLEEEDQRQGEPDERLAAEQGQRDEQAPLPAEQPRHEENEGLVAERRHREPDERLAAEQGQREEEGRLVAERQREENERLAPGQRQREEEERLVAEERQREESERLALEQRQREEEERLAAEQRQREENERLALEQRQREEKERLAAEQRRREENERLAAEQRQRQERERLAAEQHRREEKERVAVEQRRRQEEERLATEQRPREQQKRRTNTWLAIAALVLLLAGLLTAAVFFWADWQNKHKLGKLVLNTLPANAQVFVDDVARGKTPLVLDGILAGERRLRIELKGYQDEQLVIVVEPDRERFFPLVTLVPKQESATAITPVPTSPTVTPTPTSPAVTPFPTSPTVTPAPTSPTSTPATSSPTEAPTSSGFPGERFPQTRLRILTEADVAGLDYADFQYAINEMYARHGAQFLKEAEIRKQFEGFIWYVPMPEMTLSRIDREFSRIEKQNRDLLARLRDQNRPK